jgi:hypothetical protein
MPIGIRLKMKLIFIWPNGHIYPRSWTFKQIFALRFKDTNESENFRSAFPSFFLKGSENTGKVFKRI